MTATVALQASGVLVLIGLILGAFGLGSLGTAVILPGLAFGLLALMRGDAAPRYEPVPVRVRRRPDGR